MISRRTLLGVLLATAAHPVAAIGAPVGTSTVRAGKRPFSVTDMLQTEQFGKVRFVNGGRSLIYERYGPLGTQRDSSRVFVAGQARSRIYRVAVDASASPAPIFPQSADASYTFTGVSPNGSFASYYEVSRDGVRQGIVECGPGNIRPLQFSPQYSDINDERNDAAWLTDDRLIVTKNLSTRPSFQIGMHAELRDELVEQWQLARDGSAPTAIEVGSGRHANRGERLPQEELLIIDAVNGHVRKLAFGNYEICLPSPDRTLIAALRLEALKLADAAKMDHGVNAGGLQRSLVILSVDGQSDTVEPSADYDILTPSLRWSNSSRYLAFVGRRNGREWSDAEVRVFDRQTGIATTVDLGGLRLTSERMLDRLDIQLGWISDRLVVRANSQTPNGREYDWFDVAANRPINLTAALNAKSLDLIALQPDRLFFLADGLVFTVDRNGQARQIEWHGEPLTLWQPPSLRYGRLPRFKFEDAAMVVLETLPDRRKQKHIVFMDTIKAAVSNQVTVPGDAVIAAVSASSGHVAYLGKVNHVATLAIANSERSYPVVSINRFLKDILPGNPVRIDYRVRSTGEKRTAWILLPPNYTKGSRVPTVVSIYPGTVWGEKFGSSQSIETVSPLNGQILAGHDYAVLYPSLPVNYQDVPREPLENLADDVLVAVEAAIDGGFSDPDRLGIMGQSYGAYAVAGVLTQTEKFKAAVCLAGMYDLVSMYGTFDPRRILLHPDNGLDLFWVSLTETSQIGMGSPPWTDPERYLRNSPLMHVENIRTPVMLMHGDRDYLSTTQSEEFFTALTRLSKDAKFVRYLGEDHIYNSPANIIDMWKRISAWFDSYLKPNLGW